MDTRKEGTVGYEIAPRSYEVKTPSGMIRRNRRYIIRFPAKNTSHGRPECHDSDSNETISDDRSQEEGCRHHQLIPFGGVVV